MKQDDMEMVNSALELNQSVNDFRLNMELVKQSLLMEYIEKNHELYDEDLLSMSQIMTNFEALGNEGALINAGDMILNSEASISRVLMAGTDAIEAILERIRQALTDVFWTKDLDTAKHITQKDIDQNWDKLKDATLTYLQYFHYEKGIFDAHTPKKVFERKYTLKEMSVLGLEPKSVGLMQLQRGTNFQYLEALVYKTPKGDRRVGLAWKGTVKDTFRNPKEFFEGLQAAIKYLNEYKNYNWDAVPKRAKYWRDEINKIHKKGNVDYTDKKLVEAWGNYLLFTSLFHIIAAYRIFAKRVVSVALSNV